MGEIKSTLDIIMEKAQNLTVTDEDKKQFKEKEIRSRIRGLFQKYLDGIIRLHQLQSEMATFSPDQVEQARVSLKELSLEGLTTNGDNNPVFDILNQVLGIDISPITELIQSIENEQRAAKDKMTAEQAAQLRQKGITGTAVIPNIKANKTWRDYLTEAEKQFQKKLSALKLEMPSLE